MCIAAFAYIRDGRFVSCVGQSDTKLFIHRKVTRGGNLNLHCAINVSKTRCQGNDLRLLLGQKRAFSECGIDSESVVQPLQTIASLTTRPVIDFSMRDRMMCDLVYSPLTFQIVGTEVKLRDEIMWMSVSLPAEELRRVGAESIPFPVGLLQLI